MGLAKEAKPFLKWVGGKSGLLLQIEKLLPKKYNRYFEPFLGGGALFFRIKPSKTFLNDINKSLISAYHHIKINPALLIALLKRLQNDYVKADEKERAKLYSQIRDEYNKAKIGSVNRSAYLIFLNKTGYNGLYRENSSGKFNVPFGRYKKPKILDEDNLLAVSRLLQGSKLTHLSFLEAVKEAKKGDFIYFDPPYHPLNGTSKFTNYTEHNFTSDDQVKLRDVFRELAEKGCYVMLSNSHSKFIQDLYKDFRQEVVYANRAINCKAAGRGKIKELVILNY